MWDHTDERIQAHSCAGDTLPQSGLYVLKHKDLEKGAVLVDRKSTRLNSSH